MLVSTTQVFTVAMNPFGTSELKDKHKVCKDCSALSLLLANSAHCFALDKEELYILTIGGQLYYL